MLALESLDEVVLAINVHLESELVAQKVEELLVEVDEMTSAMFEPDNGVTRVEGVGCGKSNCSVRYNFV